MEQFKYTIKDEFGIHARPAGQLVKKASDFTSSIVIHIGGKEAPANKLFAIMALCAKQGDELIVTVEGEDEKTAAAALQEFLKSNL